MEGLTLSEYYCENHFKPEEDSDSVTYYQSDGQSFHKKVIEAQETVFDRIQRLRKRKRKK